jgi:hypothetical protein
MNRRRFLTLASTSVLARALLTNEAFAASTASSDEMESKAVWELVIEQSNQPSLHVDNFALLKNDTHIIKKTLNGFDVEASIHYVDSLWVLSAKVRSKESGRQCFLSLSRSYGEDSRPLNFNGEVTESAIYRQSPHNPATYGLDKAMQPVPLIALRAPAGIEVAICDTPAHFENYTSQTYDLGVRRLRLSSGDHGLKWNAQSRTFELASAESNPDAANRPRIEPHAFSLDGGAAHGMEVVLMQFPIVALAEFRQRANLGITRQWSDGEVTDLLGATNFGTAYMNLRVNETARSRYWVVPAIEYSNKQYSRDAFWISMMLAPEYSQSCFENEAANDTAFTGAERQLFTLVWAYRNHRNGFAVDEACVERILRIVEAHAPEGFYSGFSTETRKLGCWQGWADVIAFDRDDAISNNQGLFVVALLCAQAMGLKTKVSSEQALENYRGLFNRSLSAYPISRKRTKILAVDPLMGDLLAQVYLGKKLLPSEQALAHYRTMKEKARTENGFKVFCAADGSYLPREEYNSKEFTAAIGNATDGSYQCGGSWYLYDMQMLMDAHLHGATDAEDLMIWRTKLEFSIGGTTHEYIDTATGNAFKPNMGWNGGVYGLWKEIMKKGLATDRFLREIDHLRSQQSA